ncbi:MAG: NAD-dependent epimerase/dehydratase family protein [Janthinobacterium lividum]
MRKVLLIGSTGFVGRHIKEALVDEVVLIETTRQTELAHELAIYFDFAQTASWQNVLDLAPDVIINSAGYGVVKEQTNVDAMYDINYRLPVRFVAFLQANNLLPFWLQVGTAFEYDLEAEALTEESNCVPLTHYGISKYLCSSFLLSTKNRLPFLIVRPFAMFGPYESASKLLPYLINAQRIGSAIALSTGEQRRDYFYVKDLAVFLKKMVKGDFNNLTTKVFNIGRGVPISLKTLATELSTFIPGFEPNLWQWGKIPQRENENQVFYNASEEAQAYGLKIRPLAEAFQETVDYYFQPY